CLNLSRLDSNFFFFFFQAEDGIRDRNVTGVQTCALPISIGYATAIVIGGYTLFIQGFKNLSKFKFDMKTLMTIAIIGAAAIGQWGEGAMVVILFAISEALERYSVDKARQSIESLMDIAPKEAVIRRNNEEIKVHVEDILVGDIMIVKPGQKLAM